MKKKKLYICFIIILTVLIVILYIINGFYFRSKREQIMNQLGVAICNKDIDLLDSLVSPDCTVGTIDGKLRNYSYQRSIIESSWNTESYSVTGYHYYLLDPEEFFWNRTFVQNTAHMIITDSNGKEYVLALVVNIDRTSLSDAKITHWSGLLNEQ
ncbi:MAG: hypothetical protein ACI4DW_07940 [Lachnospiraceae bacterium]